jgi:N-acyl amino acid synthase of PEP-CTERM/exosortase system
MHEISLAKHFQKYFEIQRANTLKLKNIVYKIRYDVYAAELKYEKNCPKDCEKDKFDDYSNHILVKHKSSGMYAGCVRLVSPPQSDKNLSLPFEEFCLSSVDSDKIQELNKFDRSTMGELSRLAVTSTFRRRKGELVNPQGINMDNFSKDISKEEMRFFPFIAVALYMACGSIALAQGVKYVFAMMEPRLAKHLSRFGIQFTQFGNTMEYHGQRALFLIDEATLLEKQKPELKEFFQLISDQLKE